MQESVTALEQQIAEERAAAEGINTYTSPKF